jgi:hypothetical protein
MFNGKARDSVPASRNIAVIPDHLTPKLPAKSSSR